MAAAERRFAAMGGEAQVIVVGAGAATATRRAEARVRELESRWSRFLPDSDLARCNDGSGTVVAVHPDTILLVRTLVAAWHLSGGTCDATVRPGAGPAPGPTSIAVDRSSRTVALPVGTRLDPGAVGKGLAADVVLTELLGAGAEGALVSLGGDLRAAGTPPDGIAWTVDIEHPANRDAIVARLRAGAFGVATSTPGTRTLDGPDGPVPHLLDPTTGSPVATDVASATVVAGEAWVAEALATAAVSGGSVRGPVFVERAGAGCLVVRDDGRALASGLDPFLTEVLAA